MTDEKIKALIVHVEEMIAEQESVLRYAKETRQEFIIRKTLDILSGMRQVLAVIKLYLE